MQQQVKIDLSQTSGYKCPQCASAFFEQSLLLRKVSKFLSGLSEDVYMPVQVINCKQCGLLAKDALDPNIRSMLNLADEPESETPVITLSN
jgi:uncharacterized Zn finger protein